MYLLMLILRYIQQMPVRWIIEVATPTVPCHGVRRITKPQVVGTCMDSTGLKYESSK